MKFSHCLCALGSLIASGPCWLELTAIVGPVQGRLFNVTKCEAIRQSWPLQKVFFSDCCLRSWFHALVFLKSKFVHARGRSALLILIPTPTLVQTFQKSGFSVLSVAEICGWQLEVQRQIERRQGVAGRWGTQMCSWVKLQDQESRGHYWKNGSQRNMVKNPRTCNVWYIMIYRYIIYIYIIAIYTSSSILGCHVKCSGLQEQRLIHHHHSSAWYQPKLTQSSDISGSPGTVPDYWARGPVVYTDDRWWCLICSWLSPSGRWYPSKYFWNGFLNVSINYQMKVRPSRAWAQTPNPWMWRSSHLPFTSLLHRSWWGSWGWDEL